jgi:PHD/YefM family antitoxin component YafN of YafNO toxin-antitoxin module
MKTASLLEFSANLKAYLDNIERDNETLFVKRSKHKGTVIISIAEYNSLI